MIITKIAKQKKSDKRLNLYVDGEFACGLSVDTVGKYGLRTGDKISKKILDELIGFDEYIYAKKVSYDLLSYRIRSSKEIRDKLKLKKISPKIIDKTIAHLNELNFIDDDEFAKQFIMSNTSSKPLGKTLIRQKLHMNGIADDVIDRALTQYYVDEREKEYAEKIFLKYSRYFKKEDTVKNKMKSFGYLVRKGFNYDIINEIIRENIK
ncbi:MAG: RecX family transcriptional regulator [Ignavibacteria bacterium]